MNVQTVIQRNNVRTLGPIDGPVLVLVQGFGCDQIIWNRILPYLTDSFRVVLFDHVGTGGADPDAYDAARYASLDGYMGDLAEVLEALDLRDATVVGHSVAGMMALAASVESPRITRLVLLCTSACYLNDEEYVGGFRSEDIESLLDTVASNYPLWVSRIAPAIAGENGDAAITDELEENICRLNPSYVHDFLQMSFRTDIRQLLPRVQVPTLILNAQSDPLTPESATAFLHRNLPQSTRVDLRTRGTMPHLSSPGETAEAIVQYLSAVTHA